MAYRRLALLGSQLESTVSSSSQNSLHGLQRHMAAAATQSTWAQIEQAPPDAILGITEAFKRDKSKDKINLGVGAYRTEEGKPLVLEVVREAEQRLVSDPNLDKEYLGITGLPEFCRLSAILAFGEDSKVLAEKRNATVQSLSGTGSLRVGGEFLAHHYPNKPILLPKPTWPNHNKLFPLAGMKVEQYRYYKPETCGLDYEGMLEDFRSAPEGAVVLLHACAHNPTGVDPTKEQWQGILDVVREKKLLPFFDSAYQGFATGDLEGDAHAIRLFADAGMEFLLAQSYAKNLGLYGERVGALSVVTSDPAITKKVESQLKAYVRPLYSSPPRHGAEIVVKILSDPQLYSQWRVELQGMADRIKAMRSQLFQALQDVGAPGTWNHIVDQIGMFSFTGLTKEQVHNMTDKWHVYMTFDGRISMAGLSGSKCQRLAEAIKDSVSH
ncbi:hypothetical protein WJX73_007890 [Symbiochloris irregularis]|uniref:Aspartate aminotransferase n=1 Tax=Symbiochloris irregularis TaxID=706552 RepID=A0AAW1NNV5_9CHLO